MPTNKTTYIKNNQAISLHDIPILPYAEFSKKIIQLLKNNNNHCVNYFAFPCSDEFQLIACIANDTKGTITLLSHKLNPKLTQELESLTQHHFPLHVFEREIHENFGIRFLNHPWLKPIRFPQTEPNQPSQINKYPFYTIKSEELHEVGVGPIHAGVIEPGHFRFICNGENVLHLEIQLGWQHRGIEKLFIQKEKLLQRNILAENIAGDTVIGHTLAFSQLMESLAEKKVSERLLVERAIALELERIAIHVGDISALCTDVAYSLGANVFGVLRTSIINFTQLWCGNRLGKGMVRVGGSHYPLNQDLRKKLLAVLNDFEERFVQMSHKAYQLPSVENRFDDIGIVTTEQAQLIGSVGMAARMTNVKRDIRESHPFAGFKKFPYETILMKKGDVFARFLLRRKEIKMSIAWIKDILNNYNFESHETNKPENNLILKPTTFSLSLTEGWRGEICHCGITDAQGNLSYYKIKDPSLHNWKSLELSLRNLEISDFPINNKSYNLSYCGHDL